MSGDKKDLFFDEGASKMASCRGSRIAAVGLVALVWSGLVIESAAAESPTTTHCVVEVVAERDGRYITGPESCSPSFQEAQMTASESESDYATAAGSNTIGVHFTGTNFTGSSITIVGDVCSGGVWWPTGSWNNNIASSYHYCGSKPTIFYDSSSCSGTSRTIYNASSTLYTMNDRASCVRYG